MKAVRNAVATDININKHICLEEKQVQSPVPGFTLDKYWYKIQKTIVFAW